MPTRARKPNTPAEALSQIEVAVREEFAGQTPTKKAVILFLRTKCLPRMDGGASVALLLLLLKYSGVASVILAGYNTIRSHKKPPKCPFKGCPKYQVKVDDKGRSVCSDGHKWRPS